MLDPAEAQQVGCRFRADRTGSKGGGGSGCRKKWKRADGGSVNEVNSENGKGENQSRERGEMLGGRDGDCSSKKMGGGGGRERAAGNAWQAESRERKSKQLECSE